MTPATHKFMWIWFWMICHRCWWFFFNVAHVKCFFFCHIWGVSYYISFRLFLIAWNIRHSIRLHMHFYLRINEWKYLQFTWQKKITLTYLLDFGNCKNVPLEIANRGKDWKMWHLWLSLTVASQLLHPFPMMALANQSLLFLFD